jgi:hypothetical protein
MNHAFDLCVLALAAALLAPTGLAQDSTDTTDPSDPTAVTPGTTVVGAEDSAPGAAAPD